MSEMPVPRAEPRLAAGLRLALMALAVIIFTELTRLLKPQIPLWLGLPLGTCALGYGLFLTVDRIRKPAPRDADDARRFAAPMFIILGAVVLSFHLIKFVTE